MESEHRAAYLRLWTDLTRLASRTHAAAPATLLAFVAWQAGNGALANVALDRAVVADPNYSMAQLLRQIIASGSPPENAEPPLTLKEVTATYAEQYRMNS